ncbi:hypothetical protein [Methanosarcina sp. 1.H.A.2.2]|uniref:hypothetical protein n=1 Tax=Methanosarcina sp. 1.H.A.2.2 TaxID=1483601 RepID=UPI000AB7D6C5|nr:hypothetical protein [Methanosarcina sp. 1.H.A.2.2]
MGLEHDRNYFSGKLDSVERGSLTDREGCKNIWFKNLKYTSRDLKQLKPDATTINITV